MLLSVALAISTMTSSFDVGGLKVILRESDANNVVAANLYLLGGTRQITAANAGIEPLLLEVSERGTRNYPKTTLRRKMSRLGSEIRMFGGMCCCSNRRSTRSRTCDGSLCAITV